MWCELCRDHFDSNHFDDEGRHKIGWSYGPSGRSAQWCQEALSLLCEIANVESLPPGLSYQAQRLIKLGRSI